MPRAPRHGPGGNANGREARARAPLALCPDSHLRGARHLPDVIGLSEDNRGAAERERSRAERSKLSLCGAAMTATLPSVKESGSRPAGFILGVHLLQNPAREAYPPELDHPLNEKIVNS